MERQRTEVAPAEAPAVVRHGEAHFLDGGNAAESVVHRVYLAHVGKLRDFVKLFARKRHRGRVDNERVASVRLPQRLAADGIVLLVFKLRRKCIGALVRAYFFIRRAVDMVKGADFGRARHERCAANICQGFDLFTLCESSRDRARGIFAHAVDKKVCLRVENERTAHLVVPVVVVGKAAQARLQSADDNGNVAEGFAAAVRIDNGRAVGPQAHLAAGRVEVTRAVLFRRRVVCDHRVDVAAADHHAVAWATHCAEGVRAVPVGLGEYRHAVALGLQYARDDRRAEAWVVNIGVRRDNEKVVIVPAALDHFVLRNRQKGLFELLFLHFSITSCNLFQQDSSSYSKSFSNVTLSASSRTGWKPHFSAQCSATALLLGMRPVERMEQPCARA